VADSPLDTNVIVRFLVERPETIDTHFKGVFRFFERIEAGSLVVYLPDLVLFQSFFVLTSHYRIPARAVAEKLGLLVAFRGIRMTQKSVALACMERLSRESMDLVDRFRNNISIT